MFYFTRSQAIPVLFSTVIFISGCGTIDGAATPNKSGVTIYDRKGSDVIIEPTTGNSFLLTEQGVSDEFCMAPPPDMSDAKGSGASLALKGVALSDNTSVSVATLGGRSPAVLISREILYRTCELYVNLRLKKEDAIALFKDSMSRVIDVTKAQIAQGTAAQFSSNSSGGPAPAGASGPAPADGSGPAPADGSGPAPANGSGPAPADGSGPAPANGSGPAPAGGS